MMATAVSISEAERGSNGWGEEEEEEGEGVVVVVVVGWMDVEEVSGMEEEGGSEGVRWAVILDRREGAILIF